MRADVLRTYKSVHTWTGIIAGMALFIAFYAGALTVFKEPLLRWVSPPVALLPLEQAPELITRTLAAHPEAAREFGIYLKEGAEVPARMVWEVRAEDADDHDRSTVRHFTATLDENGQAQVGEIHPSQLGDFIDVLHRVVGLPYDIDPNRWIMGVIALLYVLALVSGLIVLLPTLVKDLFALRVGRNLKRMWLDAHNVVGLVSLPFHLVMALTAVVFAFHDGFYAVQNPLIHGGQVASSLRARPPTGADAPRDPAALLAPDDLAGRARAGAPGFSPYLIQYQRVTGPQPAARVWGSEGTALAPRARGGFISMDPYTGKVLSTEFAPGRQSAANATIASFFALHMASFGGLTVKWLYFLLGLAGAWLFYGGNLLWVETRRKRASRHDTVAPAQRRDTRLMAAATVGICLGSVAGISATIVAGKVLHGVVDDVAAWHRIVYYLVFFAGLVWAFHRGAGQAAVHLLWAACLLTLAIPLSSLAGALVPALGWWAHTDAASLGVDATAFVGAVVLALMARATARRVRTGPGDSVWSGRVDDRELGAPREASGPRAAGAAADV